MKTKDKPWSKALLVFTVIMLLGISSCFDDNYDFNNISDEFELAPGISLPLAYGTLRLNEIISEADLDDYVKEDEDSLLYIIYEENLVSYRASDVVDIPDQNFINFVVDFDVSVPFTLPVPVGETMPVPITLDKSGEFVFDNGERIDSLNLYSTSMQVDIKSSFHHTGVLTITSAGILVNGIPFKKDIQISNSTGNFEESFIDDLTNVKIVLDNSNPDTTYLPLKFDLLLINSGANVLPEESCEISISLKQNIFSSFFGYLGEYDILASTGSIDVSLFNERVEGGSLRFADPRLALTVNNSYGIPLQIELRDVNMVSTINSSTTPITFFGVNPFDLSAPEVSEIGNSKYSEVPINNDNSNIVEAMETSPNHLNYRAYAKTNALGLSGPYNFITDSSTMDLGVQVVLPIWVKAEGFALEDTLDFNFEEEVGTDIDMVEYFRLSIETDNGLPVETKLQVYFADVNYTILDSMFRDSQVLLDPATVGANDKVNSPKNRVSRVEFNTAQLEKIKSTKYAFVRASVNTPATGTGYFKFYSYYGIDFKLSAKADIRVNSKDL